ncbi:uncharacterized protein [Anabrus simplex]|uniref:uncharacterized protein n=1 Tax=Anabrus simplex TaxID=316456 RepID=UPI0035A39ED9
MSLYNPARCSVPFTLKYKMQTFVIKNTIVFLCVLHAALGHAVGVAGSSVSFPGPNGVFFQQKPLQITVQTACSNLASRELSDACLGCFWRLSGELQDSEYRGVLSDCTSTYLQSTIYSKCGSDLKESLAAADGKNATAFCGFGKCVRDVHSKQLINSCIEKSQKDSSDPAEVYTKTTSCILCKTFCIDKKFKVQYEYGRRVPAITLESNNQLKLSVYPYYSVSNEGLCTSNAPGGDMPEPIEGCDCNLPENEI